MSDFGQTGLICTLQRLNSAHLERIETELTELAKTRPIALILPCHGRDLEQPAFARLLEELQGAHFLHEIVLSVNEVSPTARERLSAQLAELPQPAIRLNNEARSGEPAGKGANVRAAIAHLVREGDCGIIATQDCDVASFRRLDLDR